MSCDLPDRSPAPQHRVLLVEDDPDVVVVLLREAFVQCGLGPPIHVSCDGDDAVSYLAGNPPYGDRDEHPLPSLVLLDLKLPRRDGHEVLEWIRAHTEFAALPVVVLTSSSRDGDIERAYACGANSYLVKPPQFGELTAMVRMLSTFWPVRESV